MILQKTVTGKGNPITLIHGGGCNYRYMLPIQEKLSNQYCVTSINLPGVEKSNWNPSICNIDDIADQVTLQKAACYIGWSFGGLVAMSIASRYPEKVSHFIGIGTTPKYIAEGNWPGFPPPGFEIYFQKKTENEHRQFLKNLLENELKNVSPKSKNLFQMEEIFQQKFDINLESVFNIVRICDGTDLRKTFSELSCPVDLIFGTEDNTVPMANIEKLSKLNPKANIHLVQGAHHMPFWTHPHEFNQILNKILNF